MLIPLSIDAPVYHYPKATILLIATNIFMFFAVWFGPTEWILTGVMNLGTVNPIQWVTALFIHISPFHLVGNLFFLWAFGLIVEGKLGSRGMLFLFFSYGVGLNAMLQLANSGAAGGVHYGASSAVMGLMGMSFVWAPRNEIGTVVFVFLYPLTFEITVYWYCVLCVIEKLIGIFAFEAGMLGAFGVQVFGAFAGFAAGTLYLKKGWVDCENWDLYRVIAGTYGPYANPETTVGSHADPTLMFGTTDVVIKNSDPHSSKRALKKNQLRQVNELVDSNQFIEAAEVMFDVRMKDSNAGLKQSRLKKLALGLIQANMPDEAEIYLEESVERFPEDCEWARVRLAQIALVVNKRPRAAIDHLQGIRLSQLSASQANLAKKLAATAKKQIREGVEDAEMEW